MRSDAKKFTHLFGLVPHQWLSSIVLALLLAVSTLVWWHAWRSLNSDLMLTFIDVGQGDCVLINSPAGKSLLIDGGGDARPTAGWDEVGHSLVVPALYRAGIKKLDGIVVTHPHDDHAAGLREVVRQVPAGLLMENGDTYSTAVYDELLIDIKKRRVPVIQAKAGQVFNLGRGIRAEVIHPNPPLLNGTENDQNNNSVAILLRYDQVSVLLLGDLQQEGDKALLSEYPDLTANAIKLGHHGSMDSTSPELLAKTGAKWAIISAGRQNSFGHPHEETLAKLKHAGVKALRTDELGTITLTTDGRKLQARWGRGSRSGADELNCVKRSN